MTSTDSIVKREVQDEKFWFRLTFTTCLWNCPHLVSVARYFFSDLIYAKIWTSSRWIQVLLQFIVSFSSLPSTQLRENWSLVTASRTLCASPESSDRFRDSSFQSCPIILLEFYLLDDIDHWSSIIRAALERTTIFRPITIVSSPWVPVHSRHCWPLSSERAPWDKYSWCVWSIRCRWILNHQNW